MKFRRILDVLGLQVLQKRFWAQFHEMCVQKLSCLRWSSDAFWKSFTCKFYSKSSGHNFSICASKNEAVCCEVQTHFGGFHFSSFIKKSSGRIFPIYASKNKAVCREIQMHFGSFLPASFTEKVVGAIPRFVRPKTKLIAVKFRRILKVLCLQGLQKKFWAQFHDLCV